MADVETLLNTLLAVEGGYSNNPNDSGGETNWGITIAIARANGYAGPMRDMTRDQAKAIYRSEYWSRPHFDQVAAVYSRVGAELLDTGVNMGQATAARFLQRALNALTGAGLVTDGQIGPGTLQRLGVFKAARGAAGETILLRALDGLQTARYVELTEQNARDRTFFYGWIANRIGNA